MIIEMSCKQHVFPAIGLSVVGLLVGWFAGQSNLHETVVAALVPAVMALVGAGVFYWLVTHPDSASKSLLSGLLIAFSLSIFIGTLFGQQMTNKQANENLGQYLELRPHYLRQCADIEFQVNQYRMALELPPLESAAVCR